MEKQYGCGIIVVNNEGKILLGQRVKAKTKSDHMQYCIPGGGIEEEEEPHEGAIRELQEEVNLKANLDNMTILCITNLVDHISKSHKVDHTFIHFIDDEVPVAKEDEMTNLKFYTLKEIMKLAHKGKLYPATLVSIGNYINVMAQ